MSDLDRLRFLWRGLPQQLWWRSPVWSAVAVLVALTSMLADVLVPADWLLPLQEGQVVHLLRIMATTMLAVRTFSLSVLASAYASASSAATPRATRLVVADPQSQKSVAVFLASFIFSIGGVIAMGMGRCVPAGRMVQFVSALGVGLGGGGLHALHRRAVANRARVAHHRHGGTGQAARCRKPCGGHRAGPRWPRRCPPEHAAGADRVALVDLLAAGPKVRLCPSQPASPGKEPGRRLPSPLVSPRR